MQHNDVSSASVGHHFDIMCALGCSSPAKARIINVFVLHCAASETLNASCQPCCFRTGHSKFTDSAPLSVLPPPPHPPKKKENIFFFKFGFFEQQITLANPPLPSNHPLKKNFFLFQTWIHLEKKKKKTLSTPPPLPLPPTRIFFVRFGFFIKKIHFSGFFVKENFSYPSHQPSPPPPPKKYLFSLTPPPPPPKKYLFSLTLSMTSYYLEVTMTYISWSLVQRFRDFALSNRKTSYRSLKQTTGSTSCPWITILPVVCNF